MGEVPDDGKWNPDFVDVIRICRDHKGSRAEGEMASDEVRA